MRLDATDKQADGYAVAAIVAGLLFIAVIVGSGVLAQRQRNAWETACYERGGEAYHGRCFKKGAEILLPMGGALR